MIYDSHFHLCALDPDWRPNPVLSGGLAVTTQPSDWSFTFDRLSLLSSRWFLALGVHPWFAHLAPGWTEFESLLSEHPSLAVGEIGLDGSFGHANSSHQLAVFKQQMHFACDYKRVISLHLVNDGEQGYQLLRAMRGFKAGVVHGFNGSLVQAQRWQALGFYLGIGPRFLASLNDKKRQLLRSLDKRFIHLESDAPSGHHRFNVSSPNDLPPYLDLLSRELDMSRDDLSEQLYLNWCHLWGIADER